jgi:hypothetical protein
MRRRCTLERRDAEIVRDRIPGVMGEVNSCHGRLKDLAARWTKTPGFGQAGAENLAKAFRLHPGKYKTDYRPIVLKQLDASLTQRSPPSSTLHAYTTGHKDSIVRNGRSVSKPANIVG